MGKFDPHSVILVDRHGLEDVSTEDVTPERAMELLEEVDRVYREGTSRKAVGAWYANQALWVYWHYRLWRYEPEYDTVRQAAFGRFGISYSSFQNGVRAVEALEKRRGIATEVICQMYHLTIWYVLADVILGSPDPNDPPTEQVEAWLLSPEVGARSLRAQILGEDEQSWEVQAQEAVEKIRPYRGVLAAAGIHLVQMDPSCQRDTKGGIIARDILDDDYPEFQLDLTEERVVVHYCPHCGAHVEPHDLVGMP